MLCLSLLSWASLELFLSSAGLSEQQRITANIAKCCSIIKKLHPEVVGYFESLRSIRPHASSIIPIVISSWLCRGHPAEKPHSFPSPSVIVNSVCPAACQPENPKAANPLPNMMRRAVTFFMNSYPRTLCYAALSLSAVRFSHCLTRGPAFRASNRQPGSNPHPAITARTANFDRPSQMPLRRQPGPLHASTRTRRPTPII